MIIQIFAGLPLLYQTENVFVFDIPEIRAMAADGLDEETLRQLQASPWWSEMVEDVVETPDYAEPDEPADVVLGYARDVVKEYVRKRFVIMS